jgi:cob(I)alamin adenosyltransferase
MVVLNKIYTKTGDGGTTALASGERRVKHDLRIEAYGTVDETNSVVGLARLAVAGAFPDLDQVLARIQNDLFDLGADLATPETEAPAYPPLRVVASQVAAIEAEIDRLNGELEPLRSFVLPGGSPAAAHLHHARTVSRRAERLITALGERETITPEALVYMNRLSDFFFVAARYVNDKGRADVLWVPGKNR